ncbi:MAG: MarC family protein [Burkholderiaceae bacterium]|jgi:small neutral amino acid transporter SnatA (MarC family)
MTYTFVSAVVLLLLVADPLGNIPIFVAALRGVPRRRKPAVILRECLIAFGILLAFMFMGNTFLAVLGLTDVSLQIGGGVILFLIALRMVFPVPEGIFGTSPGGEPFIVPLAIPALAGPSALGTVLLLVSRDPARVLEWVAALTVAMLISAAVLVFSERLQKWLGERALIAFERLMGLVLTAIAVEMILKGLRTFIADLPHA